ncbi:MAG: 2-oxo-4-hydroxy-4-carboxy-5-ureidoimidazoline decarboxylase [Verrucomicrobiota bacterium]
MVDVNALSQEDFIAHFGPVFEHSPWIAGEAWLHRPFGSRADLLGELTATLRRAPLARQIGLIQAHPDLAGRLARQGRLTTDSTAEQASAGLDRLAPEELRQFEEYNQKYREKFGFPFVVCARLADKRAILLAFQKRLHLSREAEIQTALDEIEKIAALRLTPLVRP